MAELKWEGNVLSLGAFRVGEVKEFTRHWFGYRAPVHAPAFNDKYDNEADARRDCESEVRRLLKSAGVVVES